jgi:sigma-B regulation protein RsbU (phosphoserine phosphatase)
MASPGTEPPAIRAAQAHARELLDVIAQLPVALAAAGSTRALHDAVRSAVTRLLGQVRALELFLVEGPTGAVVPSGEPREGVPLLDALWAAGEPLTQQPALLAPSKDHGEILSIPILDRAGPLGVLVIEAEAGARRFRSADIDDMTLVGGQLIVALQRLHLERRAAAHRRVERDMVLAREVQRRFLPPPLPLGLGIRVEAHYRPAHDVGGDFYDLAVDHEAGTVTFIVGDVSGRGVAAALTMARLTADLRVMLARERSPAKVLERLDRFIAAQDDPEQLATALCWRIDGDGRVVAANAGHAPPLIRLAHQGATRVVAPSGPPLGAGAGWTDEHFQLDDADTLFVFTDGLIDAVAAAGQGNDHALCRLLAEGPAELDATCARVLTAAERQRLVRPIDDFTLVAVQVVR